MSIAVVCPKCLVRLQVSEKFAGKEGPCPKCKATIQIPKLEDQVKVHAPEDYGGGGKDAKGRPVLKPIEREETKVRPKAIAGIVLGVIATFVAAYFVGRSGPPSYVITGLGLLVVSPFLVLGAYTVLRDQEIEPYSGKTLWLRCLACAAVFMVMWGVFGFLFDRIEEPVLWIFYLVPFVAVGTLTAFALLDLDYMSAVFLYGFYLIVTALLRVVAGLPILNAGSSVPIDY